MAAARYKLEVTIGQGTRDKLREAQELLAHAVPGGDVEQILDRALDLLIEKTTKRRFGAPQRRKQAGAASRRKGSSRRRAPKDSTASAEKRAAPSRDSARTESSPPPPSSARTASSPPPPSSARTESPPSQPPATSPSSSSRYVSAAVRRAVFERDGRRCAYVSPSGLRCEERGCLELHHREPHGRGGPATVDNLELRCRAHNLHQAELDYGPAKIRKHATPARESIR